ncbi:unnamed protein product [Prunus armeniaca]
MKEVAAGAGCKAALAAGLRCGVAGGAATMFSAVGPRVRKVVATRSCGVVEARIHRGLSCCRGLAPCALASNHDCLEGIG